MSFLMQDRLTVEKFRQQGLKTRLSGFETG